MDEIPSIRGQLIIRSIIEEYKHLLEVLGDERMLKKGNRPGAGLGPGRPTDDQFDGARVTQEILQKLTRLFQQLRISYNQCVDELERSGEIKVWAMPCFRPRLYYCLVLILIARYRISL